MFAAVFSAANLGAGVRSVLERENTTECAHAYYSPFPLYTCNVARVRTHPPLARRHPWGSGRANQSDGSVLKTCIEFRDHPKWCIDCAPTEIAAWLRLRSRRILHPTAADSVRRVVFIIGIPCGEFFVSHPSYALSLRQVVLAAIGAVPECLQFISNRINCELHDVAVVN